MNLLVLQHVPFEGPACIRLWAEKNAVQLQTHCCAAGGDFPGRSHFDGFIIMGGPMGVNDDLEWLGDEKRYIQQVLESGKPVLGICLGAQLIACCLGAEVRKHRQREIGWFPVTTTSQDHWLTKLLPDTFTPLHWHGDTFEIPQNCLQLFESEICTNQAFAMGEKVLGLQFHLEFDPNTAKRVGEACADELADDVSSVQSLAEILADQQRFSNANNLMFKLLDGLFSK